MGRSVFHKSVELFKKLKKHFTAKDDRVYWEVKGNRRDGWFVTLRGPLNTSARRTLFEGQLCGPETELDCDPVRFLLPADALRWFLLTVAGKDAEAKMVASGAKIHLEES